MEENAHDVESPKPAETEFKLPVLVGRVGKLPKKAKSDGDKDLQEEEKVITGPDAPESSSKSKLPPAVLFKEISTPIPYKEPKWSGLCPDGSEYALEVLKSGMIVEKVDLTTKAYYVFGRLANCDVVMAHPTISRHHAILQYKAFADSDEPPSGWYLYDLDSTHGTYLNRERLKAHHYTRVRVGHQIKFGNSTRTYILLGPDFDCEGESELTVTEIKKRAEVMKQERDRMIQEAIEQRERDRLEEERKKEEQGIDWGMGEDAEDEPDLSENPYATTANEELFLQDPKKTLRGYFEREGLELTYDCEERGPGQFLCRVELPLEDARGRPQAAEALHRGKKKDAVVACALAACRALDRAGVLRQPTHEPRRRKQREWADDDSDDDTFLDRTGAVESKRARRARQDAPLTYEQLLEQIKELEERLGAERDSLERMRAVARAPSEEDYMAVANTMAHKAEISKARMSISKLQAELESRRRLAAAARPAAPPLRTAHAARAAHAAHAASLKATNSVVYGKRIRLKEDKKPQKPRPQIQQDQEFVEEVDSDEETADSIETKPTDITDAKTTKNTETKLADAKTTDNTERADAENIHKPVIDKMDVTDVKKVKRVFGPMRPPENYVIPENYFDQESDRDLPEIIEE